MKLQQYQVDAFANRVFEGNPAAVCPLKEWLSDDLMQEIAAENNLAETAFIVKEGENFRIRWFTPKTEVDLCGHATLASAFIMFKELGFDRDSITFDSRSGPLIVRQNSDFIEMDFPNEPVSPCDPPIGVHKALGLNDIDVRECYIGGDLIVQLASEQAVYEAKPNVSLLSQIDARGVIITAESSEYDFVNRCFYPNLGINEDPVTGSAFTQLVPMWAQQLQRSEFHAKQVSQRGGEVSCELNGARVTLRGRASLFMRAEIML